jgi:energy-coupling factor transporter ATP-binding protein EcfA2
MTAFDLRDVTFRYAAAPADALAGVTLAVSAGEICWIYGSPGAGATTLLLVAAGLAPRFTGGEVGGQVRLCGENPHDEQGRRALRGRVAHLGPVPEVQLSGVADTVFEEIAFGPANLGWPIDRIRQAVDRAARRLGVSHLLPRRPQHLSGGEKQRVVFASLLALDPAIWLLDEADSALDAEGRQVIAALLREESERGAAVIVAAEDADAMVDVAERVVLLDRGSVAFDGAPRALLSDDLAWERGPGGTSIAGLSRAVHARSGAAAFSPPYPLDVAEAVTRWR